MKGYSRQDGAEVVSCGFRLQCRQTGRLAENYAFHRWAIR